jgi:hypothetical protein
MWERSLPDLQSLTVSMWRGGAAVPQIRQRMEVLFGISPCDATIRHWRRGVERGRPIAQGPLHGIYERLAAMSSGDEDVEEVKELLAKLQRRQDEDDKMKERRNLMRGKTAVA